MRTSESRASAASSAYAAYISLLVPESLCWQAWTPFLKLRETFYACQCVRAHEINQRMFRICVKRRSRAGAAVGRRAHTRNDGGAYTEVHQPWTVRSGGCVPLWGLYNWWLAVHVS